MKKQTTPEKPGHHANCVAKDDVDYMTIVIDAILRDATNLLPSYRSTDCTRDSATVKRRLASEGATFATKVLPDLFSAIVGKLEGLEPSFRGFRKLPQSQTPALMGRLIDMVWNHEANDTLALQVIYQVCFAFKKLKGEYSPSVLSDNLDKFINCDASLLSINYTDREVRAIIVKAKQYIDTVFKDMDTFEFVPRPGPGAVNTPLKPYLRYQPHVRYAQLEDAFSYPLWFYTNAFGFKSSVGSYFGLPRKLYPTSRMKFVHKYANKPRGIFIEENETQWLQQALKNFLYKRIESHPMTKGRVNFSSQSINRDLALRSSSDKSFCTIDMSEASNRIARDLVFILFRDTPLLPYLDALSTRIVKYPKEVRDGQLLTQLFAPMGSAICFPVMSIVHFALCKAIVAQRGGDKKASRHIYVYGDDILLPSEFTEEIINCLPKFGMKINSDKSYYRSAFRESCGLHAYKGVEITPVCNNYTLNSNCKLTDTTRLLSSLAKEALYFEKGFELTAAVVRRHIRFLYGQIPYGTFASRLLCFKRSTHHNLHQKWCALKERYNAELQRREYYLRVVENRFTGQLSLLGSAALLRWYVHTDEDAAKFADWDEHVVRRRWVSESDLDTVV